MNTHYYSITNTHLYPPNTILPVLQLSIKQSNLSLSCIGYEAYIHPFTHTQRLL